MWAHLKYIQIGKSIAFHPIPNYISDISTRFFPLSFRKTERCKGRIFQSVNLKAFILCRMYQSVKSLNVFITERIDG